MLFSRLSYGDPYVPTCRTLTLTLTLTHRILTLNPSSDDAVPGASSPSAGGGGRRGGGGGGAVEEGTIYEVAAADCPPVYVALVDELADMAAVEVP